MVINLCPRNGLSWMCFHPQVPGKVLALYEPLTIFPIMKVTPTLSYKHDRIDTLRWIFALITRSRPKTMSAPFHNWSVKHIRAGKLIGFALI